MFRKTYKKFQSLCIAILCLFRVSPELQNAFQFTFNSAKGIAGGAVAVTGGAATVALANRGCGEWRLFRSSKNILFNIRKETKAISEFEESFKIKLPREEWDQKAKNILKRKNGEDLSPEEIWAKWRNEPKFRAMMVNELEETNPELFKNTIQPLLDNYISLSLKEKTPENAVAKIIQTDYIKLYDASGNVIPQRTNMVRSAEEGIIEKAQRIAELLLKNVPSEKLEDESAFADALSKVFSTDPNFKYNVDIFTGKLKITYKSKRGDICGELDMYKVIIRGFAIAGVGISPILLKQLYVENDTSKVNKK